MNEILMYNSGPIIHRILTASGRSIYRHESDKGSVIEFTMYGNPVSLFVADNVYFSFMQINKNNKDGNSGTQLNNLGYKVSPNITVCSNTAQKPIMTDAQLTSSLKVTNRADLEYSRYACNTLMAKFTRTPYAIPYTRGLNLVDNTGCDLPNIFELAVICTEAEYLQELDPTYNEDATYYIGYNNKTGKRWNAQTWSCTRGDGSCSAKVMTTSCTTKVVCSDINGLVIPIRELGIN